ncbi:MAG TPA: M20 family metallopeptidase [Desulfosporosinus sp.]|nr:M20 family metallopeptidase [Desulfosporosinus sp.]
MQKYLDYLQDKEIYILKLIRELVELESPTLDKVLTDYFATTLKDIFEKYTGGKAEIIDDQQYGNHVRGHFGDGKEQILIVGHFDTVQLAGTLKSNPFKIENGKAYGPGIYDMKSGIVQAIFALVAVKEIGTVLNKKVVCLFNSDEEIGSVSSTQLLIEEAGRSKYAFIMEPSFGDQGAIKIARKGVGTYKLTVSGKSAHAGNCPEEGINAIEEICRQVLYLQGLNDYSKGISVNCGIINGGSAKNSVPDYAALTIDVRASRLKDCEILHNHICNLKSCNPLAKLHVEGSFSRKPMEKTTENYRLYTLARDLMTENCHLPLPEAAVGGASDGNITSALVPTLDGLGAVGSGAHSLNEQIYISHLVPRTALLAALLEYC